MATYQAKPNKIEAVQWTGRNIREVQDYLGVESFSIYKNKIVLTHSTTVISIGEYIFYYSDDPLHRYYVMSDDEFNDKFEMKND